MIIILDRRSEIAARRQEGNALRCSHNHIQNTDTLHVFLTTTVELMQKCTFVLFAAFIVHGDWGEHLNLLPINRSHRRGRVIDEIEVLIGMEAVYVADYRV